MFVAPTYANSPAPSLHIIITSQLFAMPFNTLSCPTYDSHLHTSLAKPRINAALVACPAVPCLDALRFRVSTPCSSVSQRPAVPCLEALRFRVSMPCGSMSQRPAVPCLDALRFHVSTPCSSVSQRPAVACLDALRFHVSTPCGSMSRRPAVPCLDALRFRVSTPCGSMSQCTAAPCLKLSAEGSSLHRSLLHLCITSSLHTQIFPSALCPTQTQSAFFLAVIKETKFHIHAQPSWVRDKKTFVLHVRQDSALNCLFV